MGLSSATCVQQCGQNCDFEDCYAEPPFAKCGNNAVDSGEQCDGAQLNGKTCQTLGIGYAGGVLRCGRDCRFDRSSCTLPAPQPTCGNMVAEPSEQCDGSQLKGQTCQSLGLGYTAGALACTDSCTFDVRGCTLPPSIPEATPTPSPRPVCTLKSVSLTPQCGNDGCEQGEDININAEYSGLCSEMSFLQIDAISDDGSCSIGASGSIQGIQKLCLSSPCIRTWSIPAVAESCNG